MFEMLLEENGEVTDAYVFRGLDEWKYEKKDSCVTWKLLLTGRKHGIDFQFDILLLQNKQSLVFGFN